MLPTEGYFSSFPCPYFETGSCERPHCHFRHCKEDKLNTQAEERSSSSEKLVDKQNINVQSNLIEHLVAETVKQVLSRTEITENSAISAVDTNAIVENVVKTLKKPSLEVNDYNEAHNSFSHIETTPSYKPTPISELNKKHIPVMCAPTKPVIDLRRKRKTLEVTNNSSYFNSSLNSTNDVTAKEESITTDVASKEESHAIEVTLKEEPIKSISELTSDAEINIDFQENMKPEDDTYNPCTNKESCIDDMGSDKTSIDCFEVESKKQISSKENKVKKSTHSDSKKVDRKRGKSESSGEDHNSVINGKCTFSKEKTSKSRSHASSHSKDKKKKKKKHSDKDKNKDKDKSKEKKGEPVKPTYASESIILSDDDDDNVDSGIFNENCSSGTIPQLHSFEEIIKSGPLSPPVKKKKIEVSSVDRSQISLCERWRRVRETINKRSTGEKIKISQVPNVSSLLSAKDFLLSKAVQQQNIVSHLQSPVPAASKTLSADEEPSANRKVRISHMPKVDYPSLLMEPDLKVPVSVRQLGLNNIYDEIRKYVDISKAKELAQVEELKICKRVNVIKTYKNSIAMTILRIRKDKGVIQEEKETRCEKSLNFTSACTPDFTYGLSLYKCFSNYLMTDNDFIINGFPLQLKLKKGCAYVDKSARRAEAQLPKEFNSRICINCSSHYFVNDGGFPYKENDCFYHWGKVIKVKGIRGWVEKYRCCGADVGADPCTSGQYHVSNTLNEDCLEGFVTSLPLPADQNEESAGIYAMDCEMCFTTIGSELTRCTLVDLNGQVIYDKVVVPENPILDYCTRFSGITEEVIKKASVNIKTVQKDLLKLINQKTILLGHSLENDFKALKLIHRSVVDTSIVFPHKMGLPYKNALKRLAKDFLNICIQENESGHDSYEDANACMKLMLWKIKEDSKKRKPRVIIGLMDRRKHSAQ